MDRDRSDRPEGGWFSYSAMGQGPVEPLDDAYSQFTNTERFKPLHQWALEIVARLQSEYEVTVAKMVDFSYRLTSAIPEDAV